MSFESTEHSNITISRKEQALLVLLLILAALAFHQLATWETESDFMPDVVDAFFFASGISPSFIYVLVVGLFFIRRKDIAAAYREEGELWSAILFLLPGICLFLWGHFVSATDIIYISFILTGFGAARSLAGRKLTRAILPPVLILVLATPLPAVLINQIIFPLQLHDTAHSVWLLNIFGIPALAMGDVISMAENSARFAESCTALGFIIWLTIFALAYVYIFRITRWHAVLLVLSAPFIAYAVNILRAFSLVLNPALEILTIHTLQGIVFFLIGFSLLYAVDNVLMRYFHDAGGEHTEASSLTSGNDEVAAKKQGKLYGLLLMFTALLVASLTMPRWPAPAADVYPAISLADELGAWKLTANPPVKYSFLGSVRYSSTLFNEYIRGKERLSIFIGTDDRLRRHRSLLSDKNGYQGAIGLELERSSVYLGPDIGHAVAIVTDHGTKRMLHYHWYEGIDGTAKEIIYALLALDQSPLRRKQQVRLTRLSTYVELTPVGRMHADNRLRTFLKEINLSGK
jgi:exosortase